MVNWGRKKHFKWTLCGWGVDEPRKVKDEVLKFYQRRFLEVEEERPLLDGVRFNMISHEDNTFLMGKFSLEEVKGVVWEYDSNKCPRLDGFNFKFIKTFWDLLGVDFMRFVEEFHANGIIPR